MRISPPYRSPHATRIVLFAENKFIGIFIPHNDPKNSTLTILGEYNANSFRILDMHCSPSTTVVLDHSTMDIIHYDWNHDGTPVVFEVQRFDITPGSYELGTLTFGEELCRMVFYQYCDDPSIRIIDGKPIHMEIPTDQLVHTTPIRLPALSGSCVSKTSRIMTSFSVYLHSWLRIINWKHETSAIGSLLPELLQEVIAYLDWKSILSLKQTSKLFYSATNSQLIWSRIAHDLESTTGARLEEELEDYTGEELQKWCLQRHRASTAWKTTDDYLFPCTEYEVMFQGDVKFTRIIPGGRWMITATNLDFIYFIDLNSSERKCHELINLERTEQHLHAIWVDHSKRRLSFRISATETKQSPYRVRIYQVDLVGHGSAAHLTATLLSTFFSPRPGDGTALNNNYYIEQFLMPNTMKIQFFHYHVDCDEPRHVFEFETQRCITERSLFFHFIAPFWFVVHMQTMLQFCVVIPYDNSFKPRAIRKAFKINISENPDVQMSLPFQLPHETRIVVFAQNEFLGISVPHDDPLNNHTVTQLGKYHCQASEFTMSCGLRTTLVIRDQGIQLDTIRYEWSGDGSEVTSFEVKNFKHLLFWRRTLVIGEDMCRIIFYDPILQQLFYVLDGIPPS